MTGLGRPRNDIQRREEVIRLIEQAAPELHLVKR